MTIEGRDLIEIIKNKEYSEDLLKELEKYEVKKPKSVWELRDGDTCWRLGFFDRKFTVYECFWHRSVEDYVLPGMVHTTEERAERHARVLNTELAIRKWKQDNDNIEFDWSNGDLYKYSMAYSEEFGQIKIDWWNVSKFANTIYFSSKDKAQQCIDDIGEERIIEWIRWEDNDQ